MRLKRTHFWKWNAVLDFVEQFWIGWCLFNPCVVTTVTRVKGLHEFVRSVHVLNYCFESVTVGYLSCIPRILINILMLILAKYTFGRTVSVCLNASVSLSQAQIRSLLYKCLTWTAISVQQGSWNRMFESSVDQTKMQGQLKVCLILLAGCLYGAVGTTKDPLYGLNLRIPIFNVSVIYLSFITVCLCLYYTMLILIV